jgi:TPP-dependent indolepyruvate ferredoxin oxidoreductase alpha subunit
MARHNWGELLAIRIEQGTAKCPPHIEAALREVQASGDVSAGAVARYRARQAELCAGCPQRDVCDRVECLRKVKPSEAEEH